MRRQTGMPAPSLRPVSRFLARLPSLPVAALHNPVGDERLDEALAVAGRGSHEAGARDRHRARMAFRPTPSGLFAGVAIGELGAKTEVASEGPRVAHLAVSWARCAALARALLDEPEVRERTRLRAAPSLLRDGERAIWLARGRGSPAARVERAAIDPLLDRVLVATQQWARWPSVRSAAAIDDLDEGSVDELLLVLLDDGLLVDDLTPPLVGAPPLRASIERLRRRRGAREREVAEALAAIAETLEGRGSPVIPRIREARARLDLLPGSGATDGEPLAATLELRPRRMTLARAAVERAAAVAPTLLRLCHAFAPVLERATGPRLDEVLHALLARHEPGRYDLAPLALGRFGVAPGEPPPSALGAELPSLPPPAGEPPAALPPSLLRLLVARLAEGADEIALPLDELDAALPDGPPPPPTLELVLMPCRERAGEPPGAGWLLGLHGPAGATWGRFAHALGAPLAAAFDELRALEAASLDGALLADVDYAPSPSVADVATHPPLRQRTLALSSWPERGALAPADLALSVGAALEVASVADAPGALALATRDGAPVVPLP